MDSGNRLIPERRQGRGRPVRHWPCAASFNGGQEKLSLDHPDAYQRQGIIAVLRQYVLSKALLCYVGLLFLLTWYIPYRFPGWHAVISRLFAKHLLFVVALSISLVLLLLWLFLWKLPQWQVAAVPEMKDRIDLESKSRQTLAQILGGLSFLSASISPRRHYGRRKKAKLRTALPTPLRSLVIPILPYGWEESMPWSGLPKTHHLIIGRSWKC
jgi:hypothetical protein